MPDSIFAATRCARERFSVQIVADKLGGFLGQQVAVLNHPGGRGAIAARVAAGSPNDGYTIYAPAASTFITAAGQAANLPLKLPRDFAPIGFLSEQPMFIAVIPSFGVSSLPELIARAKEKPGALSYAATGVGRISHLTGELLQPIKKRCSLVIVEHDLDFIRDICDRLTVLDQGSVLDCGSVQHIQSSARVQEVYLRRA